jgi:hypothetical protein
MDLGCCFALLRRVCWPALEECYAQCMLQLWMPKSSGDLQCHKAAGIEPYYRISRIGSAPICRIINFFGKIRFGRCLFIEYSLILFFLYCYFFFEKMIFLKFRHSILELYSADPALRVRYLSCWLIPICFIINTCTSGNFFLDTKQRRD